MRIDLTCPVEWWRCDVPREDYAACDVTLYNLSEETVTSVEVTVILRDKSGEEQGRVVFRAHDLHGERDKTFTFAVPVDRDCHAQRAEVLIEKVWFDNNSVWRRGKGPLTEYTPNALPNSRALEMLRYAAGPGAVGFPAEQEGVWLCVCGRPNDPSAHACARCHREKEQVFTQYNREAIEKMSAQREKQLDLKAKAAREDASRLQLQREQEHEQRRKKNRRAVAVAVVMALCTALVYLSAFEVWPYVRYRQAVTAMEEGRFGEAEEAFAAMGNYRDAEERVLRCRYDAAKVKLDAGDEASVDEAREVFAALSDYEDSRALMDEADYLRAGLMLEDGRVEEARELFAALNGYKDSSDKETRCNYLLACALLEDGAYDEAREALLALGDYEDAQELAQEALYRAALQAIETGDADEALRCLEGLSGYKDAAEAIKQAHYMKGEQYREENDMTRAGEEFLLAGDYADAADQANGCIYTPAVQAMARGDFEQAAELFAKIPGFKDADDQYLACLYSLASQALSDMEFNLARGYLNQLPQDYKDVATLQLECVYQPADRAYERKDYQAAVEGFSQIPDYRDSAKKLQKARYALAGSLTAEGKYAEAAALYEQLGTYSDSAKQLKQARYMNAMQLLNAQQYDQAEEIFLALGDYKDCAAQLNIIRYTRACTLLEAGDWASARALFEQLAGYADAKDKLLACDYLKAQSLAEQGKAEDAAALFVALGDYENAAERAKEMYYILGQNAREVGQLLQAAAYFDKAGDVQDAAQQAEAIYDEYYGQVAQQAREAIERGEYALTATLLKGIRADELPGKYADLKEMYRLACYSEAERLYAEGKPYEAMPYYQAVPGYQNADSRLAESCYRILGTWQTRDGQAYVFRPDGTCTMAGEELYFEVSAYALNTGAAPGSLQATHSISSVNDKEAILYDLRDVKAKQIRLTRVEEGETESAATLPPMTEVTVQDEDSGEGA